VGRRWGEDPERPDNMVRGSARHPVARAVRKFRGARARRRRLVLAALGAIAAHGDLSRELNRRPVPCVELSLAAVKTTRLVARLTVTAFMVPSMENSVPSMEMNATFSSALLGK
jgi:hypothetical protein